MDIPPNIIRQCLKLVRLPETLPSSIVVGELSASEFAFAYVRDENIKRYNKKKQFAKPL